MKKIARTLTPGLISVGILTIISYLIAQLPIATQTGISSLVIAIMLGILLGNAVKYPDSWTPGIQFSAKRILRTAIVLYGFRVSFQQIASVGIEAIIIDSLVVSLTLILGYLVGTKIFKLDKDLSLLISAGAAICGAAAVLAVEDIIKSEPYKTAVAVGTVVLFGTISMFIYPLLQHSGLIQLTEHQFGVFAGASVHEVAQALVTGTNISVDAGKIAVIVKMIRVLMLVPVLFILAFLYQRKSQTAHGHKTKIIIPWFALGFLAVIGIHSMNEVPEQTVALINQIDVILLTMAMGAIGIETKFSKIKKVGLTPLYLALIIFIWLFSSVNFMVRF